jgi:hypothetical protein
MSDSSEEDFKNGIFSLTSFDQAAKQAVLVGLTTSCRVDAAARCG